ncbi:hypothetical protein BC829DRAFT_276479 [Chytridium lagenaria]|nr:hypothetical protein BC829DRAFT_276479 [Chytridium lagenaria]
MRGSMDRIQRDLAAKRDQVIAELEEKTSKKLSERMELLAKAKKMFRSKDDEYQQLRFMAARYFMLLRKHAITDVEVIEDDDRVQIAELMEKYQDSITQSDETIRHLRVQVFQLEELIEKSQTNRVVSRDVVTLAKGSSSEKRINSAAPRTVASRASRLSISERSQTPAQKLNSGHGPEQPSVPSTSGNMFRSNTPGNDVDVSSHFSVASLRADNFLSASKARKTSTGNNRVSAWDTISRFRPQSSQGEDWAVISQPCQESMNLATRWRSLTQLKSRSSKPASI